MFDLLDILLLSRGTPADDRTLAFRRIDGSPASNVIYFLPWFTPFWFARRAGFAPLDFLAAYEMPPAIVSSEPAFCVQAMRGLVRGCGAPAAEAQNQDRGCGDRRPERRHLPRHVSRQPHRSARLCSVASADRADLAIWESPATRVVKHRALKKGFRLAHYSEFLQGSHPAQNLTGIAPNSVFVVGQRDPYIPPDCNTGLLQAIATHVRGAQVIKLNTGHFKTLTAQRTLPACHARHRGRAQKNMADAGVAVSRSRRRRARPHRDATAVTVAHGEGLQIAGMNAVGVH